MKTYIKYSMILMTGVFLGGFLILGVVAYKQKILRKHYNKESIIDFRADGILVSEDKGFVVVLDPAGGQSYYNFIIAFGLGDRSTDFIALPPVVKSWEELWVAYAIDEGALYLTNNVDCYCLRVSESTFSICDYFEFLDISNLSTVYYSYKKN